MQINKLKYHIYFTVILSLFAYFSTANTANAITTPLIGWGWSSNIGWISLNSSNKDAGIGTPYGVSVDTTTGDISGYAWSSNIGWISFNSADITTGCEGSGVCSKPKINLTTGEISGWAIALSGKGRTDGWDGWIKLSGLNHTSPDTTGASGVSYNRTTGVINGYAWGGNVVGWILIDAKIPPVNNITKLPTVDLDAQPKNVNYDGSSKLSWTTENATLCVAGGGWSGEKSILNGVQSETVFSIKKDTTYTLTCSNTFGSSMDSEIVTVNQNPNDVCPNINGNQSSVPAGYHMENGECVPDSSSNTGNNPPPNTPTENPDPPVTVANPKIKLFIGNSNISTKTANDSVETVTKNVIPYKIGPTGTFNLKWASTGLGGYICRSRTIKPDGSDGSTIWNWNQSGSINGFESSLQAKITDSGTYIFYLVCKTNDVNKNDEYSNVVTLRISNAGEI